MESMQEAGQESATGVTLKPMAHQPVADSFIYDEKRAAELGELELVGSKRQPIPFNPEQLE